MIEWVQANSILIGWLTLASVILFVVSLVCVPMVLIAIPQDYFSDRARHRTAGARRHPLLHLLLVLIRNLLGLLLIAAGIAMLVLPGQGLLTILIGMLLMDFPGKFAFERWLVSRRWVLPVVNEIRRKAGRPALLLNRCRGNSAC